MSESDGGLLIGRVVIERRLFDGEGVGQDLVTAVADDGQGGDLAAVVALGMIRLAEALVIDDTGFVGG